MFFSRTEKLTQEYPATLARRPVRTIAVTGGKGGVGKTNVSVNLAVALARSGKNILLLDADLGLANVDVLLGISTGLNLSHVLSGEHSLEEIVVPGPLGIQVVPASSGVARMAELNVLEQAGLIRAFSELTLPVDVLIVDTAAGISGSVVSFVKACQEVVVVVCDEPPSITDAYALIKVLNRDHGLRQFQVLTNMVRDDAQGEHLFHKINSVAMQFLDVSLAHVGSVPFDDHLRRAVQSQCAVVEAFPGSKSAMALSRIAEHINDWPMPDSASGYLQFFVEKLIGFDAARKSGH